MKNIAIVLLAILALSSAVNSKPGFAKSFITFVKGLTIKDITPKHNQEIETDSKAQNTIQLEEVANSSAEQASDSQGELDGEDASSEPSLPNAIIPLAESQDQTENEGDSEGDDGPEEDEDDDDEGDSEGKEELPVQEQAINQIVHPIEESPESEPSTVHPPLVPIKEWVSCDGVTDLGMFISCWASQVGDSIDDTRVQKFNKIAISPYTKQFVHQKFTYRYLPSKAVKAYLPAYFTLYKSHSQNRWAKEAIETIKHCKNGFYLQLFDTNDKDLSRPKFFDFNTRFYAVDCRDLKSIKVAVFRGHRTGFWKPRQFTEANAAYAAKYSRDTFVYLIDRHFGSS